MYVTTALLLISLGVSLILGPELLQQVSPEAAQFTRVMGVIVAAFATLALWEILSAALWICFIAGFALVALPFTLLNASLSASALDLIAGLLIMGLSLLGCIERKPRGYGGGWSSLWRSEPEWPSIKWS